MLEIALSPRGTPLYELNRYVPRPQGDFNHFSLKVCKEVWILEAMSEEQSPGTGKLHVINVIRATVYRTGDALS